VRALCAPAMLFVSACWSWPNVADGGACTSRYESTVRADSPSAYLRLGESERRDAGIGDVAEDELRVLPLPSVYARELVEHGIEGALAGDSDRAVSLARGGTINVAAMRAALEGEAPPQEFAIELWLRAHGSVSEPWDLMAVPRPGVDRPEGFRIELTRDGVLVHTDENGAVGTTRITSELPAGESWHHVVVTRCAPGWTIHIDGVPSETTALAYNELTETRGEALGLIGSPLAGGPDDALDVDEIAIYPRCLETEQIASHFEAGRHCAD
jgi:hypothetical protein